MVAEVMEMLGKECMWLNCFSKIKEIGKKHSHGVIKFSSDYANISHTANGLKIL